MTEATSRMSATANPAHLEALHRRFGVRANATCGTCAHCWRRPIWNRRQGTTTERVCRQTGHQNAHGVTRYHVWKVTWTACGAFQESEA